MEASTCQTDTTDWQHFFDLRCAKDAHPDAQKLANELKELMYGSKEV